MKPEMVTHAVLLQPPPGDLTGPYPALAYLKSYAARHGYPVQVMDLGIEALDYLLQTRRLSALCRKARNLCAGLEANPLEASQQRHYELLMSVLAATRRPAWISQSMAIYRDPSRFFDYTSYKNARRGLNCLFQLLSAVHYPTVMSPAEYPTVTALKTMDNILAHRSAALNPYICFYEDVLFPRLAAHPPDLVGVSMVFANQSVQALVLGSLIKEHFPKVHVTLGGAYLSQWCMAAGDDELSQLFACADSIICGEGEEPLVHLLDRIASGNTLEDLPNLIRYDADRGRPVRFNRLIYTDISRQPPPDFSDLDMQAYLAPQPIIPYSISRGCYWGRCVFCQNRYGDHRMRRYQTVPVDKAISEINALAEQYGSNHFNFSNDVIDPAYLKRFSRAVLDCGLSFIWNTDLRAEKDFDAATCRLMARAGLNSVAIGFESGCQKTLDAMDKGKRVETIAQVFSNLYQAGVATQAMGIFGMPGETESDGAQTVQFIEDHANVISYYVMGLLMVLPGSKMHADPEAYSVTSISYEHNPLKTPEPVWRADRRMSIDSVNRLYQRLNRLEKLYAIDEYPFVGGLSTNHGFLYYRSGPDILKQLRAQEYEAVCRMNSLFQVASSSEKEFKKTKIRLQLPVMVYCARFDHSRPIAGNDASGPRRDSSKEEKNYLLLPLYPPQPLGLPEKRLLSRINGAHNLYEILKKTSGPELPAACAFLRHLCLTGAATLVMPNERG